MKKTMLISLLTLSSQLSWGQGGVEAGRALFEQNCVQCHGPQAMGVPAEEGPMLAGQFDWYLVAQLQNFRSKERVNEKMYPFIKDLSDQDFQALGAYLSQLRPHSSQASQ